MGRILNKLATALLTEKALLAIVDVTVFDRVLGLAGWAIRHGGDRALRSHPNKIIITTGVLPTFFIVELKQGQLLSPFSSSPALSNYCCGEWGE